MPSVTFPAIDFPFLAKVEIPHVRRVKLKHPRGVPITDIEATVRRAVRASRRLGALAPGASVAVGLGSRGISHIALIAREAIAELKAMGLQPFVVPSMGSHGGGTAEGQVKVLASLGMTEEYLRVPIRATMDVVDYGETADGARCKFDRHAAGADAVLVINRVKSHTTFDRPVESGLCKMVAVGLGKAEGAQQVHRIGPPGLSDTLPALARLALQKSPVAYGIALVENAAKEMVRIEGVEPEDFFTSDQRLLVEAKSFTARLPFDPIDALVVEQIGKNISGAGMDHAVMGRADLRSIPNPPPFVSRIAVLGLSKATGGNGLGVGLADFTTVGVVEQIDLQMIYMNSLTSTLVEKSRMPIVLPHDLDVLRATVSTSWSATDLTTRLCLIRSTLHLDDILISEALLADLEASGQASDIGEPFPLRFNEAGALLTRAYAADETP